MDTTLPQAILLLSLNDETGKTEAGYYQPAVAGAALADLFLKNTIELEPGSDNVIPLRHARSLGAFLGMCDQAIGAAPKPEDLSYWITTLANQKDFIATLADELCHLGALTKEKTRIFGLFTRTVWPEASPALETALKSEMATAMFAEAGTVDERICLITALAKAVGLLDYNFDTEKLAQHADRIERIAAGKCLTSETSDAVLKAVDTAIRAAHATAESITASIIR
ncbi:MAG: GPP34 family phosphoprotein [Pseudomonadota bacterium]